MPDPRTAHFPPAPATNGAGKPAIAPKEYLRPDISLLRSMVGASNQIREELKTIGDEATYLLGLRVLKTQAHLIQTLVDELLARHEKAGIE